jgi:hypothetical protein
MSRNVAPMRVLPLDVLLAVAKLAPFGVQAQAPG